VENSPPMSIYFTSASSRRADRWPLTGAAWAGIRTRAGIRTHADIRAGIRTRAGMAQLQWLAQLNGRHVSDRR